MLVTNYGSMIVQWSAIRTHTVISVLILAARKGSIFLLLLLILLSINSFNYFLRPDSQNKMMLIISKL